MHPLKLIALQLCAHNEALNKKNTDIHGGFSCANNVNFRNMNFKTSSTYTLGMVGARDT